METKKKNLLLIIQKLSDGGAERAITLLANTLKKDYNVTLITFDNRIKEYIPEVRVIDIKIPDTKNIIKKIYNFFIRRKKVKKIKKKLNINYTISYLSGPSIVNCFSKCKDKTIISIRNMQSELKKYIFRDIVNQITLTKADQIVSVSKAVEEDTKKRYRFDQSKIITIPNMIDVKNIKEKQKEPIEEKEIFEADGIKLINIGRLIPQKGQWHLIKAFKIVQEKYTNAKLIILGRGELKEELEKLIKILKLENNIFLLNYKTNPYKYLVNSDIFISSSLYEGMSNVILEAMCCELPVIATDCLGGTKEILTPNTYLDKHNTDKIQSQYGILIPKLSKDYDTTENISQEEKQLAQTIIDIIENKEKRNMYKQLAIKRAQDFSCENIKQKWIEIIENQRD